MTLAFVGELTFFFNNSSGTFYFLTGLGVEKAGMVNWGDKKI